MLKGALIGKIAMPDPEVLSSLRKQIASLQVLSCCLAHERVVIEHGLARRRPQGVGIEPGFVRVGLCAHQVRSKQLSCAHTLARHVFERAIGVSEQEGVLSGKEACQLREDLHRISHTIHLTDWTKNAVEIRYAMLQEQETVTQLPVPASLMEEQRKLAELVERHQESVQELRRMHHLLLERIDAALCSG